MATRAVARIALRCQRAIAWNEEGRVSCAFDEWTLIDTDQRAFLRLGLEFAASEYDGLWRETEQEPPF